MTPPETDAARAGDILLRWRISFGVVAAVFYLLAARPASLTLLVLAAGFVLAGCALRAWAAGHLDKGRQITVGGPYAYIRNPLYVGSFVIGLGFCTVLWRNPLPVTSGILWVVFLLAFVLVYVRKVQAEEHELDLVFPDAYRTYIKTVPPFLPWKGRVASPTAPPFSWHRYWQNREYQCLLGSLGMFALLGARYAFGF